MPVHNPPPASGGGGSDITTDADGFVHIPGLPPIRIPIETTDAGTVITSVIIKDEVAGKERTPAEVEDAS